LLNCSFLGKGRSGGVKISFKYNPPQFSPEINSGQALIGENLLFQQKLINLPTI